MDTNHCDGPLDNPGSPAPRNWITLRRLVLAMVSAAASAGVWHRTGGDQLLACGVFVVVFAALDHWVRDDSLRNHPGRTR